MADVGRRCDFDAHMDLVAVHPIFKHLQPARPSSRTSRNAPAKFDRWRPTQESIVGAGVIVSGANVRQSVLAPNVRIHAGAYVEGAVLMDGRPDR